MRNEITEKIEGVIATVRNPWVLIGSSIIGFTFEFREEYEHKMKEFVSVELVNGVSVGTKTTLKLTFSDEQKEGFKKVKFREDITQTPWTINLTKAQQKMLKSELVFLNTDTSSYYSPVSSVSGNSFYINLRHTLNTRMSKKKKKDSPKSEPKQNDLQNDYTTQSKEQKELSEGFEKLGLGILKGIDAPKVKEALRYLEEAKKWRQ